MLSKVFALAIFALIFFGIDSFAQTQMMQITSIESTVSGGLGRSRLLITHDDGKTEETDLENLFSMVGLNFKNISSNERNIMSAVKKYTKDGWKLISVTPLTISPSEGTNVGLFMTRYLLVKD
jgi:hypothetical protein